MFQEGERERERERGEREDSECLSGFCKILYLYTE